MTTKLTIHRIVALAALALAASLPLVGHGDDATPAGAPASVTIHDAGKVFGPVTFSHGAHNDYVDRGCMSCHHRGLEAGVYRCVDCHRTSARVTAAGDPPGIKRAYHVQCVGCHKNLGAGPVGCTDCHAKADAAKAR